jgi:hypothetical protein
VFLLKNVWVFHVGSPNPIMPTDDDEGKFDEKQHSQRSGKKVT